MSCGPRQLATIRIDEDRMEVDADAISDGLGLDHVTLLRQMREGRITSRCERGVAEDEGRWRLTFFSETRRLRIVIDAAGQILQRSVIDYGAQPLPSSTRR